MMNLKTCGMKWPWPNLRYCLGIYLQGLEDKLEKTS